MLTMYFYDNNLMLPNQSAHRRSHSTGTALTACFVRDHQRAGHRQSVLLSIVDLSAAFDCVDDNIFLNRLDMSYGIQSIAH